MIRSAATLRVGVLAYTPRSREYARRVLRALGYAPLVFADLKEFMAMGSDTSSLHLMLLGDAPLMDSDGEFVLENVRLAIGPDAPLLEFGLEQDAQPGTARSSVSAPGGAPQFFGDLCVSILSFLLAHGFEASKPSLSWGIYAFDPFKSSVTFEGRRVRLDAVAFDIALELFHNPGRTISKRWLKQMLPPCGEGGTWQRIDHLAHTMKDLRLSLQLRKTHGWVLETLPRVGYRLVRAGQGRAGRAGAKPARQAGGKRKAPSRRRGVDDREPLAHRSRRRSTLR